jgi:tripartite ATP-independent transporter DctP family solute receptor
VAALTMAGCGERGAGIDDEADGAGQTGGDSAGGEEYTLTLGHSVAASAPVNLGSLRFEELVEERSEGRITVEVFPAEEIGSEPELPVVADVCPELGVFALPYIIEGADDREQYENLRKLTSSDWNQEAIQKCADESGNLVVDNAWWYGNRNLTSDVEVNAPEDMQGLVIRTPPADLHTMAIRDFGAEPLPMPFSEVYTALDTGVIDGQENPISTIYQNAFFEVQDYISLTRHMTQNQALVMNQEFFEGLSEEDQELIRTAMDEAGQYQSDLQLTTNEEELELLREEGMTVVEPDLAPFKAATEQSVKEHLETLGITPEQLAELQS